jgi:hypothetical protein
MSSRGRGRHLPGTRKLADVRGGDDMLTIDHGWQLSPFRTMAPEDILRRL